MTQKADLAEQLNGVLKEGQTVDWQKLGKADLVTLIELFSDPLTLVTALLQTMSDDDKAEIRALLMQSQQIGGHMRSGGGRLIPTLPEVMEDRPIIRGIANLLGLNPQGGTQQ